MAKVRYGLLSTAQIIRNKHVPAMRASSNASFDAVASRSLEKAKAFASDCGIARAYGSYEELLLDPDLDAILIGLPNGMHHEWAIKSLEAGKHVLCEKPLAVTLQQAKEMREAAKANGVLLMEAFMHRYNPSMKFVREAVRNGTIGRVTIAKSELMFGLRPESRWKDDVRVSAPLDGGALLDAGVYPVTALSFVLGEQPESVVGTAYSRPGIKVDTAFTGTMTYPSGALGTAFTSFEGVWKCTLEVTGWEGRMTIPDMFEENGTVIIEKGGETEKKTFQAPDRFRVQLEHFSDCVLHKKPLEFPIDDGLRNVAVYESLLNSAKSGQRVKVPGI